MEEGVTTNVTTEVTEAVTEEGARAAADTEAMVARAMEVKREAVTAVT